MTFGRSVSVTTRMQNVDIRISFFVVEVKPAHRESGFLFLVIHASPVRLVVIVSWVLIKNGFDVIFIYAC